MWAIAIKEFRQLRRDRRTLALMVIVPLLQLVVFGYAARFDVEEVPTIVVGEGAGAVADRLPELFRVIETRPGGRAEAVEALRRGEAAVAVVTGPRPEVLVDGAELFSAQAALRRLAAGAAPGPGAEAPAARPAVRVLFNPGLETSAVIRENRIAEYRTHVRIHFRIER